MSLTPLMGVAARAWTVEATKVTPRLCGRLCGCQLQSRLLNARFEKTCNFTPVPRVVFVANVSCHGLPFCKLRAIMMLRGRSAGVDVQIKLWRHHDESWRSSQLVRRVFEVFQLQSVRQCQNGKVDALTQATSHVQVSEDTGVPPVQV